MVAFVLGGSQSMKTAWIEDMLSTIPQIAFLVSLLIIRRTRPGPARPFGNHRAAGVGHLVSSVALTVVGGSLAFEAVSGLLSAEHPVVGTVYLFGNTIWLGWLMMGVMAAIAVPPVLLGHAKLKLAPVLNDKLLYSDAKMNKADWQTNVASVVGVAGIGFGLWWFDAAAALVISVGITKDGIQNLRSATLDLMDRRATTHDNAKPSPVISTMTDAVEALPWVREAACRVRDLGRMLHVEMFVVPDASLLSVEQTEEIVETCRAVAWTVEDVVVMPVSRLPEALVPAADGR
ncbi:cation diffusion facilitator family transporter [Microbacterium sp. A93]|uniref:cation diffusion facilitator family transporter n=1 Tax=Microbacterium sp. A93 TaxID=3450716 RepID=UPI003F424E4C